MIQSKMKELLKNNNTLFVSNWIEYGPFCIFFVSQLDNKEYEQYLEYTNTDEDSDSEYKYFLKTLINNFFEKWLEYIYYGLTFSAIHYISDSQAIITASVNDMFEWRELPSEHIFTKIANYEYEGDPCRGKIIFTGDMKGGFRFEKPVELSTDNVKKIRKMLEMSNGNTCLVAAGSKKEIIGLDLYEKYKEECLLQFTGKNMWDLSCNQKNIVKYINGQYRLPQKKFDKDLFLEKCKKRFGNKYDKDIATVIETASHQKHGTMVIVSETAEMESKELVNAKKGTAIEKKNLTKVDKDLIIGLSSIDGAFMIDPYGKCSGIGLIIATPNAGQGTPERGARYNSAVNYVENNKKSIVVVISEDGMIDIL